MPTSATQKELEQAALQAQPIKMASLMAFVALIRKSDDLYHKQDYSDNTKLSIT